MNSHHSSNQEGNGSNLAPEVVAGFGAEWSRFDQRQLEDDERDRIFRDYFERFPWADLGEAAIGADIGCGSGRWAKVVAPLVRTLSLVDASEQALEVARSNLAGSANVMFLQASVGALPFEDAALDFAYSLGVLHHVPDTRRALCEVGRVLKPGAPLLVYLYYAFDNRPLWYRYLWRLSDLLRRMISGLPNRPRQLICDVIALTVYWPLARLAALVGRLGASLCSWPLSYYRDKSFYTMRTDALDRFGTSLEQRFTRKEITSMLEQAGFRNVTFGDREPFWCALAYRS